MTYLNNQDYQTIQDQILYDGKTGEKFDQQVTVGYIYMMKLSHLWMTRFMQGQ